MTCSWSGIVKQAHLSLLNRNSWSPSTLPRGPRCYRVQVRVVGEVSSEDVVFPRRERQYLQRSQEGLSADLGPTHLHIADFGSIFMATKTSLAGRSSHSGLGTSFARVSTLWT